MSVLVLTPVAETRRRLRQSLRRLQLPFAFAKGIGGFRTVAASACSVVICEAELEVGTWIDVLDLCDVYGSPNLIVTSRLADETLWSEVLHRGGFDVLAQPLDDAEVDRVIVLAHEAYHRRRATVGATASSVRVPSRGRLLFRSRMQSAKIGLLGVNGATS